MAKKVNQDFLQPKVLTDLTMLDPDQLPDSPSHLFACKSNFKPVESDESIVPRSSQATESSSAFAGGAALNRNTPSLSQPQITDCSLAALATAGKQLTFHGDAGSVNTSQQFSNPEHRSVNRCAANSFLQPNLQVNSCSYAITFFLREHI